ncbi:MAG: ABC-ATPase domain-containing protein [Myxococcota bacterium]
MRSLSELQQLLAQIDGRGYRAYKDLRGAVNLGDATLFIDHVQGDPFAAPSKLRVRVPLAAAGLPAPLLETRVRRLALADLLARRAADATRTSARRGSGKSGVVRVDAGGQEVLERTAVVFGDDWVELRLDAGLPAAGRRVLGRAAEDLLCGDVPRIARAGLVAEPADHAHLDTFVRCVENQEALRGQLGDAGLIAFVADGAVLPRASGASDRPLTQGAVPTTSPDTLRVSLRLDTPVDGATELAGLGVPRGVTLVVGGGYHGKSTLLQAIERGVYPHVPGDGREWVVSDPGLVKIRAEDGRRVEGVDIQAFIRDLPGGRDTRAFRSDDASGSTSQAASIVEALEAGATGLLLDEDTSATNFMVRDARMQALVHRDHEPITPFLDRVRALYDELGVSTLLVMGGCGDYFDVADHVLLLRDYQLHDASEDARRVAADHPTARQAERSGPFASAAPRVPLAESFDASRGKRDVKIDAPRVDTLRFGREEIDLRGLEQLVDGSQTRAIGHGIHLATRFMDGTRSLAEVLDALEAELERGGLDLLDPFHRPGEHPGHYARPRRYEWAAAINRLRSLRVESTTDEAPATP